MQYKEDARLLSASSEPGARRFCAFSSKTSSLKLSTQHANQSSMFTMKAIIVSTLLAFASAVVAVPPFDPAGVPNVGNGVGKQFITGQCLSDADCASGCCALPTGICSGPGAAFQQVSSIP
ncbi:hypothetical protein DL93DRAFT_2174667 [Clavulina sp. PMI_390]|nr:hypothetical protein DL93DRAFT_2174667 [Clavulina sp. PMI_390]